MDSQMILPSFTRAGGPSNSFRGRAEFDRKRRDVADQMAYIEAQTHAEVLGKGKMVCGAYSRFSRAIRCGSTPSRTSFSSDSPIRFIQAPDQCSFGHPGLSFRNAG